MVHPCLIHVHTTDRPTAARAISRYFGVDDKRYAIWAQPQLLNVGSAHEHSQPDHHSVPWALESSEKPSRLPTQLHSAYRWVFCLLELPDLLLLDLPLPDLLLLDLLLLDLLLLDLLESLG